MERSGALNFSGNLNFSGESLQTGVSRSSGLSHLEESGSSEVELAGLGQAERTVSSPKPSKPHLIEMTDFIHTIPWISKTFLEEKYVKNGRSIAQIAEEILSSRAAVRDALIEFGIPLRKQGKPGLRPAQVPYGYRRSDGLLFPILANSGLYSQ